VLPGDSLLFTAGILTAVDTVNDVKFEKLSLAFLLIAGPIAAIAGAQTGHFLGQRYGRKLFERPDSKIFRAEWVEKAEHYFNKFGPEKAVVIARFIPIVRTFLNPLAGMLGMDSKRFFVWNVVGGIIWTDTLFLLGHYLGDKVPHIDRYIIPGVVIILIISVIPILREVMKGRKVT
jgi:membrane-associated protein